MCAAYQNRLEREIAALLVLGIMVMPFVVGALAQAWLK